MKRINTTHAARHAAFVAELGGEYPRTMAPEFHALCGELIGQDTPTMIQDRIAAQGTLQGYVENAPELYGRKCATLEPHGIAGGADCDADNGEEIVTSDSAAPLAALDMEQDKQAEGLNTPFIPEVSHKAKGRGRPRIVSADDSATPEAREAIREMEVRFERAT